MADNVIANAGVGGATFATDDIGGVHHPLTKVEWGPDNTATPVDTGASALPIQDGGNSITVDGTFWQATQPVSGTVAVTGVATAANQATQTTALSAIQTAVEALDNAVAGSELQVDVVTLPALPTGTNSIGTVVDGGAGKTLKSAAVSLAASGNVVAAVSGKLIKVYAYEIQSITDGMTVQLVDDNGGNLVTILWTLNAREGVMASSVNPPAFLFKNSAQNKPIYANLTGTGTVKVLCRYWDDDAT